MKLLLQSHHYMLSLSKKIPCKYGMQPGLYMKIFKSNIRLIEFTSMILYNTHIPKRHTVYVTGTNLHEKNNGGLL